MSSETSTGLASPKSSTPNVLSGLFWRKQRKKSPIAWLCAVGTGRFGWGAIRAGNPPSDGQRQAMQERGRRLTKANRSLLSDAGRVGPVPLPVRRRVSKIGRLPSPHSLAQKATRSDHQRQRTALEAETGRSALAAGTGLHAPKLPFLTRGPNISEEWKLSFVGPSLVGGDVPRSEISRRPSGRPAGPSAATAFCSPKRCRSILHGR